MSGPVVITLEGAPVGKGRPRFGRLRGGGTIVYTPERTRKYENALKQMAALAMKTRPPIAGPVTIKIEAHFPIPKSWAKAKRAEALIGLRKPTGKPDADNILKATDAFNGVIWIDDAQVVEAHIVKAYSLIPKLIITVREAA